MTEPSESHPSAAAPATDVRALVEYIAKSLVDAPGQVFVDQVEGDVFELEVAESETGKVIGRQGRTVRAMRALVSAAGARTHKRYTLEILE
jgi:predicted RNA-binding protein YlqC (UPF0109 family)